jgi:hypothetical protein
MRQIDALTRDLPQKHVHRMTYEALCEDPRGQLQRLCEFLELEFDEAMLRRPDSGSVHHIGGSPTKFDASRAEIRHDRSHEGSFSEAELGRMRGIVREEAARWSY